MWLKSMVIMEVDLLQKLLSRDGLIYTLEKYASEKIKLNLAFIYKHADGKETTLIYLAALKGLEPEFRFLALYDWAWTKQDTLNIPNEHGFTPIFTLAYGGKLDLIKYAIQYGANIHHRDKEGYTVLHWAIRSNNLEIAKVLVNEYAMDINDPEAKIPPLLFIDYTNKSEGEIIEILKILICELGADVNRSCQEGSLLSSLLFDELLKVIQWLLDNIEGIDRNMRLYKGETPIFYANTITSFEFARDRGLGSVNDVTNCGNTILHCMVTRGDPFELIKHVIETYDLPITAKNKNGKTIIDLAQAKENYTLLKYLDELL